MSFRHGFLNLDKERVSKLFGLRTYCGTYGRTSASRTLREDDRQFDDWHVRIKFEEEEVKVLCCPEDVLCCRRDGQDHSSTECCTECRAPVCTECAHDIDVEMPFLPPAALANDMMIYYAPTILYAEKVTMMEMICASVCVTSMICFTLEKTYRTIRSFDEPTHVNSRRMACRGSASSFPLPWQDLLSQLKNSEHAVSTKESVLLPRVACGFGLGECCVCFVKDSRR